LPYVVIVGGWLLDLEAIVVVLTVLAIIPLSLIVEFQGWYDTEIRQIGDTDTLQDARNSFATVKDYLLCSSLLYFIAAFADIAVDYPLSFLNTAGLRNTELLTGFLATFLLVAAIYYWRIVDRTNRDWSQISPIPLDRIFIIILILAVNLAAFGTSFQNFFAYNIQGKVFTGLLIVSYLGGILSILKWKKISMIRGIFLAFLPWVYVFAFLCYFAIQQILSYI